MNQQMIDFLIHGGKAIGVVAVSMLITLGPFYVLYLFIVAICKAVRGPSKGSDEAIERDGFIVILNKDGSEKYRIRK